MLIQNEQISGLSLLDSDELLEDLSVAAAVKAINSTIKDEKNKITAAYFVEHLESNQFYLPSLLIIKGEFVLSFFDKNIPCEPRVEFLEAIAAKDNKAARIALSIGDDENQIGVTYTVQADAKVKPRDYVDKINPDQFKNKEIIEFLLTFIEPPVQINLPDGDYTVQNVSAEAKSTVIQVDGKLKVRVNTGCPGNVKKVRSYNGFIYTLTDDGTPVTGISITQRGIPLASADEASSAKIGDIYTILGVATLPAEHGSIHTALVVDAKGKKSYTKVNSKITTLYLTKLARKKEASAKVVGIFKPGGQRKHYDVEWGGVSR